MRYCFFTSFGLNFQNTKILLKLHFRLLVFLIVVNYSLGFANSNAMRSIALDYSTQLPDSTQKKDTASKKNPLIEDPIFSNATDSLVYSLDGKKVYLYGNAVVTYQNLELKAQYIEFDMEKKEVYAVGLPDSTGKTVGRPTFKEGNQKFEMDSIFYNFDTKRAKITGVVTEQEGGYMHSRVTKKMENDVVNLAGGKYTTCDQPHPHFYIGITKGKIIPNDKIISGPAYLVIEDVPFPIGIPFGFFPNTRKRAAGIILPEYGEENTRGLFLRGGGFYFGYSDYMDQKITGDIYSKGSWALKTLTNYRLRYRYSGSFGLDISSTVTGEKGMDDYSKNNSYWIRWSHSQDPKARPNSTFQANVNFGSSNHNRYNARNLDNILSNTFTSSISYSKVWPGTPFSMSTSLNHSQNNITKRVDVGFPRGSFNMSRIYPFKRKTAIGAPAWYEKIGLSLSTSFDNKVSVLEDNLFKKTVLDSMQNGMKHDIPLSTSFNLLKYITVSPGASWNEYWYLNTIEKRWDEATKKVYTDTIRGFNRGYQYSTSVSMSTKLYGTFSFKSTSRVQAIRHMLTPSVSLGYRPDFSEDKYDFYKTVQIDSTGRTQRYSIFEKGIYGGPGGGKSGVLNFSLGNTLEMKVFSSKDTVNNVKKIKILEGFNVGASYNLLADSMNWSDISVSGRTNLFEKININFSGAFCPYAINEKGVKLKEFEYSQTGRFARFIRGSLGFDFSLNSSKEKGKGGNQQGTNPPGDTPLGRYSDDSQFGQSLGNQYSDQYVDFNVPWNVRFSYNLSYSKPGYEKSVTQTLNFSGDLNLTPKWKIAFTSGWDFKKRQLTMTTFNIYRDLHCWDMRFTVVPIGTYKSYSFQINVKASMLQDLKYQKKEHYLDNM